MTLPILSSELSCHVTDSCTGLQCCINNNYLQQTFEVSFQLDPCENRLTIGIEKTRFNRTLTDFKWGMYIKYRQFGHFPLDLAKWYYSHIMEIMGQYDIKYIMTFTIKTMMLVLNISTTNITSTNVSQLVLLISQQQISLVQMYHS